MTRLVPLRTLARRPAFCTTVVLLGLLAVLALFGQRIWTGLDPQMALSRSFWVNRFSTFNSDTMDPWGTQVRSDNWPPYSLGPNGVDESGTGDDVSVLLPGNPQQITR